MVLRELSSTSQLPWSASNVKNLNTTGKPVEDDRHVPNTVKRTRTMQRKIAWKKFDVQTANKIIRLTQELALFIKKKKEIIEVKHKRNVSFLEARRIVGSYMGESSYASVARRADRTNDDYKYRTLMEKLIKLEANDWPKFQEHLKKLHSVEFYQAPAQQQVANGERSNVVVQTKTHVGSITPTRTTPKSAKSPSKQPLHKSPIRPPKSIKDRLKNLSPIRP